MLTGRMVHSSGAVTGPWVVFRDSSWGGGAPVGIDWAERRRCRGLIFCHDFLVH